ncbi:FAD-dependent oxidoreductase [Polyangium aurulentum]|uniref:FAD-dependent oxidoreductase n=1 Tax=Polyangium aurulentum TaxID=2567896 RepID=UPI0010ADF74C|nr:FAD-dependent oxidoreductase [Polyangium aurulentum]UQA59408.1 FAD-dependent oxidoreductase [Polyangium aurulentum]
MEFTGDDAQTLVIIGNGMVGFKLCQRMVEYGAHEQIRIVVFGEEPRPAYDRVHLSELFAGRPSASLTLAPESWYAEHGIELHLDDPVVYVDRVRSVVVSASGVEVPYNRLVFATGSRPFVPPVEGADLPGVFVYRTIEDLYEIEDHALEVRSAAIIGGGLLGLEAAKAVYDLGLRVHVVEVAKGLMPRQLDAEGANVLRGKIEQLGVKVHCGKKLTRISAMPAPAPSADGEPVHADRVLTFDDGEMLAVGMVVFSAGVRPRGELAKAAGLACSANGGIIVNDLLETSDPQIFAIGECASHRGITYGLVLPGYQMVDALAANLLGAQQRFEGADQSAKLKLMGITVAAFGAHDGDTSLGGNALVFNGGGVYRKLVVQNGRLIGAVTVGDWENLDRIHDLLKAPLPLSFWDMRRFRGTGNLWPKSESSSVTEWAPDAIVCGCLRVTRGTLDEAIAAGCSAVEELSARTGAGTLCGSCKPLMSELLGLEAPISVYEPVPASRFEGGPRSRREGGPRSRREGPRTRRGDLMPASRTDSSLRSPSVMPPSSMDSTAAPKRTSVLPPSMLDPTSSALQRASAFEVPQQPSAQFPRRLSVLISERPQAMQGLYDRMASLGPREDEDTASAPEVDSGPLSMRSATLSSKPSVELSAPPPTLRSSIPPPPSASALDGAAGLGAMMELRSSQVPFIGMPRELEGEDEAPAAARPGALAMAAQVDEHAAEKTPPSGVLVPGMLRAAAAAMIERAESSKRPPVALVPVRLRQDAGDEHAADKTPPSGVLVPDVLRAVAADRIDREVSSRPAPGSFLPKRLRADDADDAHAAVPTPRSGAFVPDMLRPAVETEPPVMPVPPAQRPVALRTEVMVSAPPRPATSPRPAAPTPAAGMVLPGLRKGEGPGVPRPSAPTPAAGMVLPSLRKGEGPGVSRTSAPTPAAGTALPELRRKKDDWPGSAPMPLGMPRPVRPASAQDTPPTGMRLDLPRRVMPEEELAAGGSLAALVPAALPRLDGDVPSSRSASRRDAPSTSRRGLSTAAPPPSSRPGSSRPGASMMDAPSTSRRSLMALAAPPPSSTGETPTSSHRLATLAPPPVITIVPAPDDGPLAGEASLFALAAAMDAAAPSSRSRRLSLEPLDPGDAPAPPSSARLRDSLLPPTDDALTPSSRDLTPGYDVAPASRRSWVPPKRLSMPPGALSVVPPARPSIQAPPERGRKILLVASIVAVSWSLVQAFVPSIPPSRSVRTGVALEALWRSDFWKQASGYTLVVLCVLSLGVSLRKRWRRFQVGDVPLWRSAHGVLGALTLLVFFLHTGLHAGARMNLVLTIDFLAVTILGAVAGAVAALSDRWAPVTARNRRLRTAWVHALVTWPLPILVALHVMAVYYF